MNIGSHSTRVIVGDTTFWSWKHRPVITVAGVVLQLREVVVLGRDGEVCFDGYLDLPEEVPVSVRHPDGAGFEMSMPLQLGEALVISAFSKQRTGFIPSERWPDKLFDD